MALVPVADPSAYGSLIELEEVGCSVESLSRLVESQKELFHSQIDQLQRIVATQCKLTGANPLSQEMAAGALSIKIGKRPRDLLNPKAMKYMQSLFSVKDTVGKKETREISALCGITVTQVRDYFASQRSRVRKLVRLSREKASKSEASKAITDGCSSTLHQSVTESKTESKDAPVNTSDDRNILDCAQDLGSSGNMTSFGQDILVGASAMLDDAFPIYTPLLEDSSSVPSTSSQVPGNSGSVTTLCTQVTGYSGNVTTMTTMCTALPVNLGNATSISIPVAGNCGSLPTVFQPFLGYPAIVTSIGSVIPGDLLNVTPVQEGHLDSTKTKIKTAEEGPSPSCASQEESTPGVDSDDKKFLENIFNLMKKEPTFSGRVKLMQWILHIHNSAVLSWFSTNGGITILAEWLSEAAQEEQTTVLLMMFKVLCHLPLNKAQPTQVSAILQTVNKLRFYRSSDIANRAKVLLSRWSKMFVKSQSLRNPKHALRNGQKEMNCKRRINGVVCGDLDITEEILALAETANDSRETEPKSAVKLLTDSSDVSTRKHARSVSATKTRERRKVQMVEPPDGKGARSAPTVARAAHSSQTRPMSADDIQKAKMRAMYMQDKYGKSSPSTSDGSPHLVKKGDGSPQNAEDQKISPASQGANGLAVKKVPQVPTKKNEIKTPPVTVAKDLHHQPETSGNPQPNLPSAEQSLDKLKNQLQWRTPPEFRINTAWRVGAGENSKEAQVQAQRNSRGTETLYPNLADIPLNPKDPWDVEMDFDDSLTPEIPIDQSPEQSPAESPVVTANAQVVGVVGAVGSGLPSTSSAAPATGPPPGSANLEPDKELLEVLLSNPEVVKALTEGEGRNLTTEQLVTLLDMVKKAGTGAKGILDGLANNLAAVQPEPEPMSLPSPTPTSNVSRTDWRSEFPSIASAPASQPHFSSSRGASAFPTTSPPAPSPPMLPTGTNNRTLNPSVIADYYRALPAPTSMLPVPQSPMTVNPLPQLPNLLPTEPPALHAPQPMQVRAPETMTLPNNYYANNSSVPAYHPGTSRLPPAVHSEHPTFAHRTPGWPPHTDNAVDFSRRDPTPDLWNSMLNGVTDDPATNSNYYNQNNIYNNNGHNVYPRRNEYGSRPENRTWSPEPAMSLLDRQAIPHGRDYSQVRKGFDQGPERPRETQQWDHGQQWDPYRGGNGGGRGGERWWRDRDRGR